MKKFIGHFTIFLLPILCLLGFNLFILTLSGELFAPDRIIACQSINNGLIGLAYSDPTKYIKLKNTEQKKPKILVLGTSRVMQFRDFFFNNPELFYNAGGAVSKIKDFNIFINTLQTDNTQVLIVGLDQYFFNKNWDDLNGLQSNYSNNFSIENILLKKNLNILKDFAEGKIDIKRLRPDGSYFIGKTSPALTEDIGFKDTFKRISDGNRRFEYSRNINNPAIKELDVFLQNCKRKNIHVIAFLPPFAHAVWNEIKSRSTDYSYIFNLKDRLEPILNSYSFDFFDFSDIASLGSTDDETLDGFHGSEIAYLRMFIKISEKCDILKYYVDLSSLNELLLNAHSSREIKHETY